MNKFVLLALLGASFVLGEKEEREAKALTNTFPFNAQTGQAGHDAHHHGHHDDHPLRQPLSSRSSGLDRNQRQRQRQQPRESPPDHLEVANARVGSDGKRCVKKVEMVEVIEYDEVVQCDHSYDKRCHTTYVTNYEPQQEEECEENFRKTCFINYEKVAFNETVEVCRTHLKKDCDPCNCEEICRTEYESECWTTHEEHQVMDDVVECNTEYEEICKPKTSGYTTSQECSKWPHEVCTVHKKPSTKYTPVTGCHKMPIQLCAPAGCKLVPGEPECHDTVKTIVQDKPKEECSLEPQRTCKHVTKLVPKLTPTEECVDVPKEVCTRSRVPKVRPVKKPVVKKWCYKPSAASGLS